MRRRQTRCGTIWRSTRPDSVLQPTATLTDAVSPIGLLSIRCPTALFWPSRARTLSSQLHDCYNWEDEEDPSSSTTSFSKRWLRRCASAAIPLRIAVVDEQKRFTLTTMCERRIV